MLSASKTLPKTTWRPSNLLTEKDKLITCLLFKVPIKNKNIPRSLFNADEKLWSVCIFASIGHGQPSSSIMLQLEVLISKFISIDGNSTGSFKYGKKSKYEIFNWKFFSSFMKTITLMKILYLNKQLYYLLWRYQFQKKTREFHTTVFLIVWLYTGCFISIWYTALWSPRWQTKIDL